MAEAVSVEELVVPVTVEYLEQDGIYKVSCPLLQGCHAWGETLDEALRDIAGNIRAMLAARATTGSSIPKLFSDAGSDVSFVLRMMPA